MYNSILRWVSITALSIAVNVVVEGFAQHGIIKGPPLDTIRKDRGGESENGIRQISKAECIAAVNGWLKRAGTASGATSIERLEMLMILDQFSQAMPGFKPKRNELLAFGMFVDGYMESVAGIYWKKKTFPAEMEVVSIYQHGSTIEGAESLLEFIEELCRDNAIIADYSPLLKYSSLFDAKSFDRLIGKKIENGSFSWSEFELTTKMSSPGLFKEAKADLIDRYMRENKAPSVYLDSSFDVNLGHYWFETEVVHETTRGASIRIPLYFRLKKGRDSEFEILFQKPEVGTGIGSGTVGNPLIVNLIDMYNDTEPGLGVNTRRSGRSSEVNLRDEGEKKDSETDERGGVSKLLLPRHITDKKQELFRLTQAIQCKIHRPQSI